MNIFIKWNFHSASNKGIYLQKKSKSMQWFNIAKLVIFKVALLHQCMELKNVFNKKAFSKNISGMTQCPSNPGFASVKVQNVDFLKKKPSVDNIFSLPLCSPNMLSSFKRKIWNVYCPVHIIEVLTSVLLLNMKKETLIF